MVARPIKIDLRLSSQELEYLNKNVRKTGLSREGYLRKLIYEIQPKESPPAEYFEILQDLRQINNNLNQIAVKANAIGFVDTAEYWKNVKWLQKSVGRIMEALY